MNLPNASILLSVNESFKPFLNLFNRNLQFSGVRYELFIISELPDFNFEFLSPKKVFLNESGSECLNEIVAHTSTPNFVFISEPFLCKKNWLKNLITLKKSIQNCGNVILPFHSFIDNFEFTHTLNNSFEIQDVLVPIKDIYCGVTLVGIETVKMLGGFNLELSFDEAIVEYTLRAKKIGQKNIASFDFITALSHQKNIEILESKSLLIERKIREFTPVEEIAYHNLDVFFENNKIQAEKFMFDFTGIIGFRCMCLNQSALENLIDFSNNYNLSFEIKSYFLTVEQKLNKNTYILFSLKE
jgi:hypothetical protein